MALCAVLCLGSTMTVMAADSPSATVTTSATTASGASVTLYQDSNEAYEDLTEAQASVLDELLNGVPADSSDTDEETISYYVDYAAKAAGVDLSDMSVSFVGMTYLAIDESQVTAEDLAAGITVTFSAPGVTSGSSVVVLHLKDDGTWEQINASAGNGTITGVFHSFSPVLYYVGATTLSTDTDTTSEGHYHYYTAYVTAPTANTWGYTTYICECGDIYYSDYVAPLSATASAVSPKTEESNAPYAMAVIALAAVAGVVVVNRKRMINN